MSKIRIYEVRSGKKLDPYIQEFPAREYDPKNHIRIDLIADDGDLWALFIPTQDWDEFVLHCQSLTLSISS